MSYHSLKMPQKNTKGTVLSVSLLEVHQKRETQCPVVHILTGLVLSGLHANTVGVFARPGHLCQVHQVAGAGGHTLLHKVEGVVK